MQDRERLLVVANQYSFGDFELQPGRVKTGSRQRGGHLQRQRAAFELNGRHIDRQPDVIRPCRGLGTGRRQHPLAELVYQAGVFRNRNEIGGRNHAALGMTPTQ